MRPLRDVSKAKLDVATGFDNYAKAIEKLIQQQTINSRKTLVVAEATGGYESLLVDTLHKSKIAIAVVIGVVNPRRIRDFLTLRQFRWAEDIRTSKSSKYTTNLHLSIRIRILRLLEASTRQVHRPLLLLRGESY